MPVNRINPVSGMLSMMARAALKPSNTGITTSSTTTSGRSSCASRTASRPSGATATTSNPCDSSNKRTPCSTIG